MIPDIKGEPNIVYEDGRFYPHHNLYYITSDEWDLRAVQAVLLSGIARLFISTYSTRMRGGYLRYQAQYLRRIRVPFWRDVPADVRAELIPAAEQADIAACNEAVFDLYGLSSSERSAMGDVPGVPQCILRGTVQYPVPKARARRAVYCGMGAPDTS